MLKLDSSNPVAAHSPPIPTRRLRNIYLEGFPEAEQLFNLGDFNLWKITPKGGRYVAGFCRTFNLVPEALRKVSVL